MTGREKVIKGLEQFIDDFGPFCGNKADWQRVYDALALLKAQEPVKPIVAHDGWYRCGNCGNSLASGERVNCETFLNSPWPLYCEMCGRAVRWK